MTTPSRAAVCLIGLVGPIFAATAETMSLAGEWSFQLDPDGVGTAQRWFARNLPGTCQLPGSLDEQRLSPKTGEHVASRLSREHAYVGPVWYQRTVVVPPDWQDKYIQLVLERCHWETRIWVDNDYVGTQNSLSVPHVYELSDWLSPGVHRLTICVDNTIKFKIGHTYGDALWAHAYTDETQTNWNGIIGRLELSATDPVWIDAIQVYPDIAAHTVRLQVTVANATRQKVTGTLEAALLPDGGATGTVAFSADTPRTTVECTVSLNSSPRLWDEFVPEMYDLRVTLSAQARAAQYRHIRNVPVGLRDFRASGSHFQLNGRRVFLRGTVDCAIFPRTGYPPMDTDEWKRIIAIIQDYGMNHVRFHSWCPPEAAFVAADEMGIVFQVEPPLWDGYGLVGSDRERAAFILAEA